MKTLGVKAAAKGLLWLTCAAIPAYVAADTHVGANLSADGGYSSNPYGSAATKGSSTATATIRFAPIITIASERTTLDLNGNVAHTEYARHYHGKTDYSAGARAGFTISPRTSANLSASFDSSISENGTGIMLPIVDPTDPNAPVILDPSIGSERRVRRKNYRVGANLSQSFSEIDQMSFSASAAAVLTSGSPTAQNYDYGSASVGYNRTINSGLSGGISFQATKTDYRKTSLGDARTLSPQLTATVGLGRGWTLAASGGASFTRTNQLGGTRSYSSPSGNLSICKKGDRWNNCLSLSRAVLPSSTNGVGNQTSASLSSAYKLDERSQLSGSLSYARSNRLGTGGRVSEDYLHSSVAYSRQLSQRLSVNASVGYSDTYRSVLRQSASYDARIGIGYMLGDVK